MAPTDIYTLSLHDALPIFQRGRELQLRAMNRHERGLEFKVGAFVFVGLSMLAALVVQFGRLGEGFKTYYGRSEEHTSELQSHHDLVCRLLLEKKKRNSTDG